MDIDIRRLCFNLRKFSGARLVCPGLYAGWLAACNKCFVVVLFLK